MNIPTKFLSFNLNYSILARNINQIFINIDSSQVVKYSSFSRTIKPAFPIRFNNTTNTASGDYKININISQQLRHQSNTSRYRQKHLSMVKLKSTENLSPSNFHSNNHSRRSLKSLSSLKSLNSGFEMKVIPVRALQDNYMYLLVDDVTKQAAAVDPVNASAISSTVHDLGVELKAILTTHHHYDHAHGNTDMLDMFPNLLVYGGDNRVQALNKLVEHGEVIKLGSLNIECLSTPCHTKGHICYYVTCNNPNSDPCDNERVVFTGDTLFIAGCGRFFEGSPEQMDRNLNTVLRSLPENTKVYCGHEYTVTNLKFALSVEPQNKDIKSKLVWAQNKVSKREATVPSTIGEEMKINPFMRLREPQVKKYTGEQDDLEVMSVLRHKKNEFKV